MSSKVWIILACLTLPAIEIVLGQEGNKFFVPGPGCGVINEIKYVSKVGNVRGELQCHCTCLCFANNMSFTLVFRSSLFYSRK